MDRQYRDAERDGDGFDFILSDGSRDRHGTRINPAGWVLGPFSRNPTALWDHGNDPEIGRKPIGNWEDVRNENGRLVGRLNPARGVSPRIDEIITLVEKGYIRAVSVGFSVVKAGTPGKSEWDYEQQELLEASLVAIGSNKNSLNKNALAEMRSLNISEPTIRMILGKHAEKDRLEATVGKQADPKTAQERAREAVAARLKVPKMSTLSQRIEHAQADLNAKRDRLAELTSADALDVEAVEALNAETEVAERSLAALKATEQRIGINAGAKPGAPNIARKPLSIQQKELSGLDLMVRAITARGISHFGRRPLDQVLEERYPGHEATAVITRADQTVGTTGVSGWASELVQTTYADFLQALMGFSIYPALRSRGLGLSFDGNGTVSIPSRTAGGAGGGFVAEGSPIRVGRITTAATTMTAKKMGVIVPFTRELAKRSTPMIEGLVRQAILEDTGAILDAAILDATASSTARPAGLINGVSAAATGYGGGDYTAVLEDFKALLGPFITANAADNITVVMNPIQGLALAMMTPPVGNPGWFSAIRDRVTIIESTYATAGRLIALRNSDFATATGDTPEFDVSEQAVVHMEDTTPLEIVSGTGPTTADPVRSFWQTGTIGVRMIMDVSWQMRRSGMVRWINGTSW